MASEAFLQFLWKNRLYRDKFLTTAAGEMLEIRHPGEHNQHAGPDFFNARIRIEQIFWAGNVEIHRRASDWYRHGHHLDPAYNNVVLHVVEEYDTDVTNSLGRRIQTLVPDYHVNLLHRYETLKSSEHWLPCGPYLGELPRQVTDSWLQTLATERLNQKVTRMEQHMNPSVLCPDEILYRVLAPGYGTPVNSLPFEWMSRGIPFPLLMEHRDRLPDLEAIFFGHSGLLQPSSRMGPYPAFLWNRYQELKAHLPEKSLPAHSWKYLRLRPASFPTLRISQFASLIHGRFPMAGYLTETASMIDLEQLFRTAASEYWTTHYLFGRRSPPSQKFPGSEFLATLMINVLIPFFRALEKKRAGSSKGLRAREILEKLGPENNQIIKNWGIFGIRAASAKQSQALLQLYHFYCKQKRCLECQIGTRIVTAAIHEKK